MKAIFYVMILVSTIYLVNSYYQIKYNWSGIDIHPDSKKGWYFFNYADPTHGTVNYGEHRELLSNQNGRIRIDVQHEIQMYAPNRKSIRLHTTPTFNNGLFVIKAEHMPAGLATWPAFWLSGRETTGAWPCSGEIDIIEGVNSVSENPNSSINAVTLHTAAGCRQDGVPGIHDPNCNSGSPGNCGCDKKSQCAYNGCGVKFQNQKTFGEGFNKNGGGVYVMELTSNGKVTVWFFEMNSIPNDLENNKPNPASWDKSKIMANFKACPGYFKNLEVIINTTLCGDWAGNAYDDYQGHKGWQNCNYAVQDSRYKMDEAYWLINYVKTFENIQSEPKSLREIFNI